MRHWEIFALAALLAAPAGAAARDGIQLRLSLYPQEQTEWCWAAVTQTVAKRFGHYKPQCRMASRFVKGTAGTYCCAEDRASTRECNAPGNLGNVLSHYGLLDRRIQSPIPTTSMLTELRKNYPVGVRIGWDRGGGHFLLVYGAARRPGPSAPLETLSVWNPLPVRHGDYAVINRAALLRYRDAGSWTDSYTMRPPS